MADRKVTHKYCVQHVTTSGLCNRLRAMAGIRAVAKLKHAEFQLCWQPSFACPGKFEELFELDGVKLILPRQAAIMRKDRACKFCRGRTGENGSTSPIRMYHSHVEHLITAPKFQRLGVGFIRKLQPLKPIRREVQKFAGKWPERVIGLHIRRTDLNSSTKPDKQFFARIDAELASNAETRFLLCCDCRATLKTYRDRYGDRIIFFTKSFNAGNPGNGTRRRLTSMRDAVIDLYLLARTRRIYGTERSSFSLYAATLGGIECERIGKKSAQPPLHDGV